MGTRLTWDQVRFCDDLSIAVSEDIERSLLDEDRLTDLRADAAEFFESYLWEMESAGPGREVLAQHALKRKVLRSFRVGYAPVGPDELIDHLRELGYATGEIVAAGLANRSPRGRAHVHFRSRVMFPVSDRDGRTLGFAGLGTHLGPSWALWVTSPNGLQYRRTNAIFGLDRAARGIAASKSAIVRPDCIAVLRSHQDGETNAVAVHSSELTREQVLALAAGVRGGVRALELDLPAGMAVESEEKRGAMEVVPAQSSAESTPEDSRPRLFNLKRVGIVIATALAAVNAWTGAPLLAVWIGSQAQSGRLLSMRGVVTVLVVLAILAFLLGWALTWLNAKYDELTGRPATAAQTSPWHRAKRGDRVQDVRSRFGVSAPERVVAGSVIAGVLAFEVWFFFFAGSPI